MKRLTLIKHSLLWGLCVLNALGSLRAQTPGPATPSAFVPAPVSVSSRFDTVADRVFRVHIVESGHTLYSIARAYRISRTDIVKNSLGDTVRIGEALYIPCGRMADFPSGLHPDSLYTGERPAALPARHPQSALTPTMASSVSKPEVPLDTITMTDDTIARTDTFPTAGHDTRALADTLPLPDSLSVRPEPLRYVWGLDSLVLNDTATARGWYDRFQYLKRKESLSVAMLLPLYLEDTSEMPVKSYAYLPFLEGWMTAYGEQLLHAAQDSLLPDIRYRVWDVTDKPASVDRALSDPDLQQADFLIAAVYTKVFDTIRRFAQRHRIPIIHPLTEQDSMAAGLPYFIQCMPSYATQATAKAGFLLREFPAERYRYVLFDDSTVFFRKRANQLYDRLTADTGRKNVQILRYSFGAARLGQLKKTFDSLFNRKNTRPTVFIGCSDKEITLLNVLITLRNADSTAAEKIFIGPSKWMTFTKIEPEYFKNIRLICYQPFYWDKTSAASLQFERHYHRHFGVLPSDLAYKGYTCYRWFSDMLRNGTVTANPFARNRWRIRPVGGWENTRLFWLELMDHAFSLWPEPENEEEEVCVPDWLPDDLGNGVEADGTPDEGELDDTTDRRESRRQRNRKNID